MLRSSRRTAAFAALVFGLFHGFGLATKLQELSLAHNGLVANILSFNVGVELDRCWPSPRF